MGSHKMLFFVIYLLLDMIEVNGIMQMQPNDVRNINRLVQRPTLPPNAAPVIPPPRYEPSFDPTTPRNITALMGKHAAYLSCRVRNLANKTVSWIRHRDIHILTVGTYTYTSDQRFQAHHHPESSDWTLTIKWPQKRDAGVYECQISTQPVRSYFVTLDVIDEVAGDEPARENPCRCPQSKVGPVPTATILGGPDLYVNQGSTINLTCAIHTSPEPPAYIFWYHHDDKRIKNGSDSKRTLGLIKNNTEVISYDSARGGVSVITEKGDTTTSFLLIQHANPADSGKYSCSPSNADVASIKVHVLNGEKPAAMQTGAAGLSNSSFNIVISLTLLLYQFTTFYRIEDIFVFLR